MITIAVRRWHPVFIPRSRRDTLWYWLLGIWVLEAAFWLMIALYAVLAVAVTRMARAGYRRYRARKAATA